VNDENSEDKSAAVPQVGAKQVEEIYGRWPWVERSVWSARMLQALEHGVKGGKWFSLIDKVRDKRNLSARANEAGVGVTITNNGQMHSLKGSGSSLW
jgi:hypothetical protein